MTTLYQTPRGPQYDPLVVEVWKADGDGPIGRVELPERVEVTWALKGAGTCVLEAAYTPLTDRIMPADGDYLLVVHFNGLRHVGPAVQADIFVTDNARKDTRVKIVTASPWTMLDYQHIPPVPDKPLSQQESAEFFELTGPVETVVKRLIEIGSARLNHPIIVTPDLGRGPQRTIKTRFDTTADLVEEALRGSGYQLRLDAWLPGDPPKPGLATPTRPVIYADVVPFREVDGLVWSADAQDIISWEYQEREGMSSQVIVRDKGEGRAQRFYSYGRLSTTGWINREVLVDQKDGESMSATAQREWKKSGVRGEMSLELAPSLTWEFGADGKYPHQYQVGDMGEAHVPPLGKPKNVITEVTVELTPVSLTVSPTIGNPDTDR